MADTLAPGDLERTADEDGSAAHRERSKIVQIALLQPTHSHTMQLRPSARTDAPHRPPRAHTRYSTSLHMNDEREAQRRAVKSAPLSGSPFPHHDYFLLLCHHALADSPPAQDHHAPCHASRGGLVARAAAHRPGVVIRIRQRNGGIPELLLEGQLGRESAARPLPRLAERRRECVARRHILGQG